jgi:hypothetical protein
MSTPIPEAIVGIFEDAGVHVELVGSRATGTPTALSDWDYRLESLDNAALATALPELCAPLETLAAQWDRLTEHATYMLMLPGAHKVDLFPGDETRPIEPPWQPAPATLASIDEHFWDWALWLGAKTLSGKQALVTEELAKLHVHLLAPLGAATWPASLADAIGLYLASSATWERSCGMAIPRRLRREVLAALSQHYVLPIGPAQR